MKRGGPDPAGGAVLAQARSAKTGSTCTIEYAGKTFTAQVARDLTVAAGDMVAVLRLDAFWLVIARLYAAAAAIQPLEADIPEPNPAETSGTLTALPIYTSSYRDGVWRTDSSDVVQGTHGAYGNSTGVAFYGDKPAALEDVTVTAARITVTRTIGPAAATTSTLWLVTETEPAGAPTLTSSTAGPTTMALETVEFTIPTAWGQALADGTAGGLAFYDADGSPWLGFAGRGSAPSAFTLAIDWTRTP